MKKILALMLSAILILSMLATMVACGSDKSDSDDEDDEEESEDSGNEGGTVVNGVTIPSGWVTFDESENGAAYGNIQTGESIVFENNERKTAAQKAEYLASFTDMGSYYVKTTTAVMGSENVTTYMTMFVFVTEVSADEYILNTVAINEVDSSRPIATGYEATLSN